MKCTAKFTLSNLTRYFHLVVYSAALFFRHISSSLRRREQPEGN